MPSEHEIQELEREWRSEGHSDEEIGSRIRSLIEREDTEEIEAPEYAAEPSVAVPSPEGYPEDWPVCPVCRGLGHVPPELQASKTQEPCPDCNGLGMVRTGSLVELEAIKDCVRCVGRGWIDTVPPREYVEPQQAGFDRRY